MEPVRRLVDFYRIQAELLWTWRRGRTQLIWRAIVSFVVAAFSLAFTAWLLPGLRIDNVFTLIAAVITIGVLSASVRPLLLALVAPFSIWLMLAIALAFQVGVILALVPLVPGIHLSAPLDAVVAALVFAIMNTLLAWLVTPDADDSYYSMLVRRLLGRRGAARTSTEPGFVFIQIDGLSHEVLQQQLQAGRVPIMSRWVNRGRMRLAPWSVLLPSQTSASQAGIMFGANDDIPAFRWYDKETKALFVSNHAADAEQLQQRLTEAGHHGLLADDGASIGNLFSGGAARSYLTVATMGDPRKGIGQSRSYFSFFLSPYGFVHAIVLGIAEIGKELFQARRARLAGIQPRLARGFPYPVLRAITNTVLRSLVTSLTIEEMLRGTSAIYVTYTDYDEIAHHSGPQRAESLDALDGVDHILGSLARVAEDAPRPYHFVILSDHGQTLGATFLQRYATTLEDLIRKLMGGADSVAAAMDELEQWRVVNSFVAELTRARGARGVTTRAIRTRDKRRERRQARAAAARAQDPPPPDQPDLVVCPSGNLALVYFADMDGRTTVEQLNERFPQMIDALANHPGVGLVLVKSAEHGSLVIGPSGVRHLADGTVDGEDPLDPYGAHADKAIRRLDGMTNCGDLALISSVDETGQIAAFEELIGSHGGMGGPQTDAFVLYPADWTIRRELVGAESVHAQLRRWMSIATSDNPVADPDELAEAAA